jgi:hypothetical protein
MNITGGFYKMKINKKQLEALKNFKNAFIELNNNFDVRLFEYLSNKYPFEYCFNELVFDVETWIDELIENKDINA